MLGSEADPEQDHEVPRHWAQRGDAEVVVAVEDSDHDPGQPQHEHEREKHAREPRCEGTELVVRPVAEDRHEPGRDHHKECSQAAEPEQHQPEERRGHPPRALSLALDEEVAEDRNECGR